MNQTAGKLAPALVDLLMRSIRVRANAELDTSQNAIYIFWHGKMLGGWFALRKLKPGALVSMSKDGELLSQLLYGWNYNLFRGSSSAGGKEALNDLSVFVSKGNSAVITPDGPRGPARYVKNGALLLSYKNGIPIVPVKVEYSSKKTLEKSWDKFEIPYPLAECSITFGKPRHYTKMLTGTELDEYKKSLADEM